MTTLSLAQARVCAPRATRVSDDLDDDVAALAAAGWSDKPKGLGFTPDEQAIANALLSDWSTRVPVDTKPTFEWSWVVNTLGRRWIVVQVVDDRRFLSTRGFTEDSLRSYLKQLRRDGCVVREAAAGKQAA